jgi:hypothetical protein
VNGVQLGHVCFNWWLLWFIQILRLLKNLTNVKHRHLMALEIKKQKGGLLVGGSNEDSLTKNVTYTNDQNNMIGT